MGDVLPERLQTWTPVPNSSRFTSIDRISDPTFPTPSDLAVDSDSQRQLVLPPLRPPSPVSSSSKMSDAEKIEQNYPPVVGTQYLARDEKAADKLPSPPPKSASRKPVGSDGKDRKATSQCQEIGLERDSGPHLAHPRAALPPSQTYKDILGFPQDIEARRAANDKTKLLEGFPQTSSFLANGPPRTTVIFRRFRSACSKKPASSRGPTCSARKVAGNL